MTKQKLYKIPWHHATII